jgi:gamma-glutamyltranspeptidase/glutathione hydrolase
MKKLILAGAAAALAFAQPALSADLSPAHWPAGVRANAEKIEADRWTPDAPVTASGKNGVVSATVSPIAVQAGLRTLEQGGTAADAATAVALTQVTTQLGSVVSYAGIMTALYYDAKTHKVYSLDGGYDSYAGETDPKSIPVADLGPLNFGRTPTVGGAKGRETLVPGYMAGFQALHDRFGKVPFADLFQPAIWYAENGVTISPHLAGFFKLRQPFLTKTDEGRAFFHQAGNDLPKAGDRFVQPQLAATLEGVASHGAAYMYDGPWAEAFVRQVQAAGGKVTAEDLKTYEPTWSEPFRDRIFGHDIYVNGAPNNTIYEVVAGLKMAEALKLDKRGPYWSDPTTFRDLMWISEFVSGAPDFNPAAKAQLAKLGVDTSRESQRTKAYAEKVASILPQLFTANDPTDSHHSNSIVVVDKAGNIAVVTHTINAVIWGDTGLVVGGIPLPDSAGFQQERLATLQPGGRVPNEIACTLTFQGSRPVLATAPIGSSLVPETIKTVLSVVGQHQDLATVTAKPALLINFDLLQVDRPLASRPVNVPQGAYDTDYLAKLKAEGLDIAEMPAATAAGLRGTLATAAIDPRTGQVSSPAVPGVMVFTGAN